MWIYDGILWIGGGCLALAAFNLKMTRNTHTHNINYDQIKTKYRQTASGLSVCRSVNSELMSGRTNDANESNEMAT